MILQINQKEILLQFNSVIIDLKTKNSIVCPTKDVMISPSNSLTFFRGQTFFSSAFTVKNDRGVFLLELDTHYERLLTSYDVMFSRYDFPFTFNEFKSYVQDAIDANKTEDETMHCIIYLVAGKPNVLTYDDDNYSNGFGGYLDKLVILLNPYKKKPDWCYEDGLNLFSAVYQRPIAASKPVNYIHGALMQQTLDGLNTFACLENKFESTEKVKESLLNVFKFYEKLSIHEQKECLSFFNTLLYNYRNLDTSNITELMTNLNPKIKIKLPWLSQINTANLKDIYKDFFPDLFHEVMFTGSGSNPYILEGSTFSFMGINKKNQCVFNPLTGNSIDYDDTNSGTILNSTTISLLKRVADKYGIQYLEKPFKLNDVLSFKAFYCISTTRIKFENNTYHLQPCRSINTTSLNYSQTDSYLKLMKGLHDYILNYSYDFNPSKKEFPYTLTQVN